MRTTALLDWLRMSATARVPRRHIRRARGRPPTPYQEAATPATLSAIESCYFAALIEGLRVIDEKADELGRVGDYSIALQHYVEAKGKRIAIACGL